MENTSSKLFYSKASDQHVSYVTDKALTNNIENKSVVCFDSLSSTGTYSHLYYDLENIDKGVLIYSHLTIKLMVWKR